MPGRHNAISTHIVQGIHKRMVRIQKLTRNSFLTADMLHRVWYEFDYPVEVCRVTQGAHIEGL